MTPLPPGKWRTWLLHLTRFGQQCLAAFGLALLIGFGAVVAALMVFAFIADDVMEQETQHIDDAVLVWLRQFSSPNLDLVAWIFSALGSELVAVGVVVLLVVLARQRRWGTVGGLLLTVGGAQLLNNVLKDYFGRLRPAPVDALIPAQQFSFPSGHAMVSAAFYLFLGYLAWRLLQGRARLVCVAGLGLLVMLIGLSRLYLGVHYITDVFAGYAVGLAWADVVLIGSRCFAGRPAPRPEPALASPNGSDGDRKALGPPWAWAARAAAFILLVGIIASSVGAQIQEVDAGFSFSGEVEALPSDGLVGTWQVGGRAVQVTDVTEIERTSFSPAVGERVTIEGNVLTDHVIAASEIELGYDD